MPAFELTRLQKPAPVAPATSATSLAANTLFRPRGWHHTNVFLRCRDGAVRFSLSTPHAPLVYTESELRSGAFGNVDVLDASYKMSVVEHY